MDVNELRTIITVACFIAFIGIVYWAYSGRQKSRFDEAANLPFADDDMQERTLAESRNAENMLNGISNPVNEDLRLDASKVSSTSSIRKEQDHG